MIETVMVFALGFLVAILCALLALPAVNVRASPREIVDSGHKFFGSVSRGRKVSGAPGSSTPRAEA
ncbi:DUF1134 domain-containing protein, partial [Methylobacterium sp. WL116]